ncbi:hypothetical protein GCM10009127_12170 [Alteraurantiacibacter aestuarii]|uniref:histidine kinase n=1 Tax=Alteraurantiacibacter aestuarii TaxID=650004 RepID=A0A844ZK03_9SPHN|nr:ATP-binding protein [Alteraurantiacibacter aestuarii]MXO87602.1 PAS domain S-box protein [Alteraurantiacibacter aestuarii]
MTVFIDDDLPLALDSAQMSSFMDIMPIAIILADQQGIIRAAGRAVENHIGYAPKELVGQNLKILMASPHRERHDGYIARYHETGERRIIGNPRIENARHKNGHAIAVEVNVGETMIEGQPYFLGFLRLIEADATDRQQIQTMLSELAHVSRVSAMGALAAAIAHELNQPLTSIANFAAGARERLLARDDAEELAEVTDVLDICSRQAVRAGHLLHQLRDFLRPAEAGAELVSVEALVDATISLALINGYRRTIELDVDVPGNLPLLMIDHVQAEQVLFNIVRNAFEAMQDDHERPHKVRITARALDAGMIEIAIEDSGPGIDPSVQGRVFDSFVTTKPRGMGVGLTICRQIVEAHGGSIDADNSTALGGALFRLQLPAQPTDKPQVA